MTKETSAQEVSVHVEEAPAKRLLDAKAAANMCGVSRSHFLSMHNSGRIPLPVRLGRAVRWDRRELDLDQRRLSLAQRVGSSPR